MSFAANPWRSVWLKFDPKTQRFYFECSGCGGGWKTQYQPQLSIADLWGEYINHLVESHKLIIPTSPEEFGRDW